MFKKPPHPPRATDAGRRRLGPAVVVLFVLGAAGCESPELEPTLSPRTASSDFERVDLWMDPPVDATTGEPAERSAAQNGAHRGRAGAILQTTGLVQGLAQQAGSRWQKDLSLGASPSFSFQPLPVDQPEFVECRCVFRLSVEDLATGEQHLLGDAELDPTARFGGERVHWSLEPWAGQQVRLHFELEALPDSPGTRALWSGPEVVHLKPKAELAFQRADQRPNVVLIIGDTLRADALGAWGKSPSVTPTLDALAQQSQRWSRAFSTLNSTNPSISSLMTGLYAKNHGIYNHRTHLGTERITLAEYFAEAGYKTMAVLSARHVGAVELDQGFETVYRAENVYTARLAVDQAMRWLDFYGSQPFFIVVHLFDVHMPHTPQFPYAEGAVPSTRYGLGPVLSWDQVRDRSIPALEREDAGGGATDLYHAELSYLDRQLDRFFGYLEARSLIEDSIVAFTSDHGENLTEYGILFDHRGLYDTTTHVPLMIRWPGGRDAGNVNDALVQHMDLFPTLLGAAGITPRIPTDARSLIDPDTPRRAVFAEHANLEGESVRTALHRFTSYRNSGDYGTAEFLFSAGNEDPDADQLTADERTATQLRKALTTWLALRPYARDVVPVELDAEAIQQLEALGYVQ